MVENTVYYGIAVAIVSGGIQSLGLVLQRKAVIQRYGRKKNNLCLSPGSSTERITVKTPIYTDKVWQLGFAMFIVANLLGSTVQIATLPLAVVAPLQSASLLFNSWFSSWLLEEPFTRKSLVATCLICIGGALLATMGTRISSTADGELWKHDFSKLLALATRSEFVVYFVVTNLIALVLVGYVVSDWCRIRRGSTDIHATTENDWNGKVLWGRRSQLWGLLLAHASGIWSAYSLLCAKCLADIILGDIGKHSGMLTLVRHSLPVLFFLCFFALSQLYLLNYSLHYLPTSILYPLVFSVYNIATIINSAMLYDGEQRVSVTCILGILIGIVCLSGGIAILPQHHDEDIQLLLTDNSHCSLKRNSSFLPYNSFSNITRSASTDSGSYCPIYTCNDNEEQNEYISLPRRPQGIFPQNSNRHMSKLSFEQEELLLQLV